MIPRYLACTDYGWSCGHNNTVTPLFILAILAGVILLGGIAAAVRNADRKARAKQGLPPRPPREPADISPATSALLGLDAGRGYKPRGITATTPAGIRVTVRCPHRSGHRSPALAVACGEREKERIERTGR